MAGHTKWREFIKDRSPERLARVEALVKRYNAQIERANAKKKAKAKAKGSRKRASRRKASKP